MKAFQEKPIFQPVKLVLETQGEVDALHALMTFTKLSDAVGLTLQQATILINHRSEAAEALIQKVGKLIDE